VVQRAQLPIATAGLVLLLWLAASRRPLHALVTERESREL
jgi:hypothetical protein